MMQLLRDIPKSALILCLIPAVLAALPATAGEIRYHAGNGTFDLDVDPVRIAVKWSGPPLRVETAAGELGLHPDQSLAPRGAGIYTLPAPSAGAAVSTARSLANRPEIAWTSPVYILGTGEMIVTGRVLASFPEGADIDAAAARAGLRIVGPFEPLPGVWVLDDGAGSGHDLVLGAMRLVEEGLALWADPDFIMPMEKRYVPNDVRFTRQWHLNNTGLSGGQPDVDVNAPEGWDLMPADARLGHPDILIAVIDGDLEWRHEDLSDNVWTNPNEIPNNSIDDDSNGCVDDAIGGCDFLDQSGNPGDPSTPDPCDDHGTSVAGVAAAVGDNILGVTGACGACRIIGARLIGEAHSNSTTAAAFAYVARNGAAVINNSWGPGADPAPLPSSIKTAIDMAWEGGFAAQGGRVAGATVLFSAGNEAESGQTCDDDGYVAYERTIAVGAINEDGQRSLYSEFGETLDIMAPSNDNRVGRSGISTTETGYVQATVCRQANYTDWFGGTSSACPLVSGVAGLVYSVVPNIRPDRLQHILEVNANRTSRTDPGIFFPAYDPLEHGQGLVRADTAIADVAAGPTFDRLTYECMGGNPDTESDILMSVRDTPGLGSVVARVTSGSDAENVTCFEVGTRPGLYEGILQTGWDPNPVTDDGTLVINPADTLTATYNAITDTAMGTCDAAGCSRAPTFGGLTWVESPPACTPGGFIRLHWDPATDWGSGGPDRYFIYKSTNRDDPNFFDLPPDGNTVSSETSWIDVFAPLDTEIWYAVRAENDEVGCNGSYGMIDDNEVKFSGINISAGDAPPVDDLTVSREADGVTVKLSWTTYASDLQFDVYRADLTADPFTFAPACFLSGLLNSDSATDGDSLPLGSIGRYYLVTRENSGCGWSKFGPSDVPRPDPSPQPCP